MVIGEATQQALLGDDFSVTNAILVIVTLMVIDIGFSHVKRRSKRLAKLIDGGRRSLLKTALSCGIACTRPASRKTTSFRPRE